MASADLGEHDDNDGDGANSGDCEYAGVEGTGGRTSCHWLRMKLFEIPESEVNIQDPVNGKIGLTRVQWLEQKKKNGEFLQLRITTM